jgi:hypothetical protein
VKLDCYAEVDLHGNDADFCAPPSRHNCTVIECPRQGPFSALRDMFLHPALMLNGVLAVVYHVAEVLLIQNPMGVLLVGGTLLLPRLLLTNRCPACCRNRSLPSQPPFASARWSVLLPCLSGRALLIFCLIRTAGGRTGLRGARLPCGSRDSGPARQRSVRVPRG